MAAATFRELLLDDVEHLLPGDGKAPRGGDRLRRAVRRLRELGASVPAALPLAAALDRLAEEAAPALLDLLRMLRPARANLAGAGVSGALEPLPPSGPWSTAVGASELPRAVRWLRRPSWEDSWMETRSFLMGQSDLRLVGPILDRLAEKGAEVAEFAAENFMPQYGRVVLPDLRLLLERGDGHPQGQPLMAICHIDGRLGAELCRPRLGAADFKVRHDALRCLMVAAPEEARRTALAWLEGRPSRAVRYAAWQCLRQMRPAKASDLPALLRALAENRDYGAAEVVASVGRAAVRPLTEILRSPSPAARDAAVYALGYLGPRAAAAVPVLIELTYESNLSLVSTVLWALPRIGLAARAAVPRLIELVANEKSDEAAGALVELGSDDPAAAAAVVGLLDRRNFLARHAAVGRVARLGPAAAAAVPKLIALYRHPRTHWQFRRDILNALAEMGPGAAAAIPLLETALKDPQVRVRYAAALALGMIGPVGCAGVPVLIEAMHDEQESWWWSMHGDKALFALGNVGPAAAAAAPDLAQAARTEFNTRRRRLAREALAKVRGKA